MELPLSRASLATSLVFNLGVELSQILVISLRLPLLWLLPRTAVYPGMVRSASLVILAAGTFWFFQRVL